MPPWGHMALNNTFGVSMNALLQQQKTSVRFKKWIDLIGFNHVDFNKKFQKYC